ncbi:hypothetical protein BU26DRAFT_559118 [Trematosphaeria pertusa]|uniref:Uncharacterized protein n=1 Tax=Trematosphaeria pertusa TaxID=390896 RepID=A0A6A6IVM3_9PLEO|nr:uncharacterized protein BU26DRAFT_559118 [Trematosphaeria pertusa]KAF2254426.1 hypothetical protein BU26DRAFT_559118 [Trematosphaeria pertusa]
MNLNVERACTHIPFRFLDLPKEVGLMCYEWLPEKITHVFTPADCTIAVSDKCFNPAILQTCRLIYNEAHGLLFNALRHDGPQIAVAYSGLDISLLLLILDHLLPRRPCKQRRFFLAR